MGGGEGGRVGGWCRSAMGLGCFAGEEWESDRQGVAHRMQPHIHIDCNTPIACAHASTHWNIPVKSHIAINHTHRMQSTTHTHRTRMSTHWNIPVKSLPSSCASSCLARISRFPKSIAKSFSSPGRCTFTTTSSPVKRRARCTCNVVVRAWGESVQCG